MKGHGVRADIPILVLGGGIGGVAAVLSLPRRGRRVHILEKAPELAEIGAGLQLAPNAMRVLDWLGILERIKSAAVFPQTLNLLDIVTAKRLKTVDLGPAFIARYGYPYIVMHRSDLLTILIGACRPGGFGIESPDPQRRDLGDADTERRTRGGCLIVAKRTG